MANVTFDYQPLDEGDIASRQWPKVLHDFQETVTREYYPADTFTDMPGNGQGVQIAKSRLGPIDIARYTSPGTTTSLRTWRHIRNGGGDLYVIWFVTRGSLSVAQNGRSVIVPAPNFVITSSSTPFRITSLAALEGGHESYQILVPSHILVALLPSAKDICARPFRLTAASRISFQLFSLLFTEGEAVPAAIASRIAHDALEAVAAATTEQDSSTSGRIRNGRKQLVLDYIEKHLSEPGLTGAHVAAACRISPRYLHLLFANEGRSFHQHIWDSRLSRAHALLRDPRSSHLQIVEIAYLVGFRGAPHFSRAFRRKYSCRPSDVRASSS